MRGVARRVVDGLRARRARRVDDRVVGVDLGFGVGVALAFFVCSSSGVCFCANVFLYFLCLGWAIGSFDRSRVVEFFVVFAGRVFFCSLPAFSLGVCFLLSVLCRSQIYFCPQNN